MDRTGEVRHDRIQGDEGRVQRLARVVVQLPRDPFPLLLLRGDDPLQEGGEFLTALPELPRALGDHSLQPMLYFWMLASDSASFLLISSKLFPRTPISSLACTSTGSFRFPEAILRVAPMRD